MDKKNITLLLTGTILIFYIAIVLYVLFAVLDIETAANLIASIVFEFAGILFIALYILTAVNSGGIQVGFLAPLIMVTVIYEIILDVLVFANAATMSPVYFVLCNVVLLFLYMVVSVPMYLMGRR
ncbi:MAG: hypothetical protein K6F34_04985 [Lachnospiraceae bacterium]|nr:hypothetical protein [Lachnospiraceae bacterium]